MPHHEEAGRELVPTKPILLEHFPEMTTPPSSEQDTAGMAFNKPILSTKTGAGSPAESPVASHFPRDVTNLHNVILLSE